MSEDGLHWQRLWDEPFLPNGRPDEWNASESGHPYIFLAPTGKVFLFFQGNNDNGQTWYLSKVHLIWQDDRPIISPVKL